MMLYFLFYPSCCILRATAQQSLTWREVTGQGGVGLERSKQRVFVSGRDYIDFFLVYRGDWILQERQTVI